MDPTGRRRGGAPVAGAGLSAHGAMAGPASGQAVARRHPQQGQPNTFRGSTAAAPVHRQACMNATGTW
jgi:hypothetical protein